MLLQFDFFNMGRSSAEGLTGMEPVESMNNYGQSVGTPVFDHPCAPLTKILS
jgi:hypothetical protein